MSYTERAAAIRLIAFDVDGVLTDGRLFFSATGESCKAFDVRDGMGITLLHKAGLKTAIITARTSQIVSCRGAELQINNICQGVADKASTLQQLMDKYNISRAETAYVGDDINDLPAMLCAGLVCAPANAAAEVKAQAHFISLQYGGRGAVRDIAEMIIKAQGKWDSLIESYRQSGKPYLPQ